MRYVKTLPTVVAARDGSAALAIDSFVDFQRVPCRLAYSYAYRVRLAPDEESIIVEVLFSDVVGIVDPRNYGLPALGTRNEQFATFAEAALGDHIDKNGCLSRPEPGQTVQIECFSPHLQDWADRTPATDDEIESYLRHHAYWAWRFRSDRWQLGPSDALRLHVAVDTIARLIDIGEPDHWTVTDRTESGLVLHPSRSFVQEQRKMSKAPVPSDERGESAVLRTNSETTPPDYAYVDESRIGDMKRLTGQFDLRKLIALCEELNLCYRSQCYHAVAALTRAVIDHVPPVFGKRTFPEVVNNCAGTRSFKECVARLDTAARTIADGHLHTAMRRRETLPTRTQVNFSNELDVLLGEVIRLLESVQGTAGGV